MFSVVVILCVGLAALSVSRRRILLLCFFYLSFGVLTIVNVDTVPLLGGLKLYRLAYPFLFLSALASVIQNAKSYERLECLPNQPYLVVLFSLVISSFYSRYGNALSVSDPGGIVGTLLVTLLFWIAASHVQSGGDFMAFASTAAILSTVLSLWVIWTAAQGEGGFTAFRGGTNVNENYESLYILAGGIPFLYSAIACRGILARAGSWCGLVITLMASSILASRGTLIAAAAGGVATALGLLAKRPRGEVIAFALASASLIGVLALLPGTSNVVDALRAVEVGTLDDRTIIWGYTWRHLLSSGPLQILFGEGLSSGRTVLAFAAGGYGNYHNDYLAWLMERGLIGLCLCLLFLRRIWQIIEATHDQHKHLMRGWFIYLCVAGLSATVSIEHLYWVIMGAIAGVASEAEIDRAKRELKVATQGGPLPSGTPRGFPDRHGQPA